MEIADARMWFQGIGAVADISNDNTSFRTKSASPLSYVSFLELFGLHTDDVSSMQPVAHEAGLCGLPSVITPHSTYSLNDPGFKAAIDAGGGCGLPLSIHFMESPGEKELYMGSGEMSQWYRERNMTVGFTEYGSPARRIVECVPPERDIMLIHNTCVTEEDVDIIEGHFTGRVTWVLCPRSNRYIMGAHPPVELLRRKGVNIAIGTDSLASNTSLDMAAEMASLKGVPLEELIHWATAAGAAALGLEELYGTIEIGSRTGMVLLTGIDWDKMALTPEAATRRIL